MQFYKKTSIAKSNSIFLTLIKSAFVILILFVVLILIDKIDFPSPIKKIEKIVPNENLKVVK